MEQATDHENNTLQKGSNESTYFLSNKLSK